MAVLLHHLPIPATLAATMMSRHRLKIQGNIKCNATGILTATGLTENSPPPMGVSLSNSGQAECPVSGESSRITTKGMMLFKDKCHTKLEVIT
jgi:hypothetical protein